MLRVNVIHAKHDTQIISLSLYTVTWMRLLLLWLRSIRFLNTFNSEQYTYTQSQYKIYLCESALRDKSRSVIFIKISLHACREQQISYCICVFVRLSVFTVHRIELDFRYTIYQKVEIFIRATRVTHIEIIFYRNEQNHK